MTDDIYAFAGRYAAPVFDYDFTNEYLTKLRGADFIPARKKTDYKRIETVNRKRNYFTPLMQSVNKSRNKGKEKRSEIIPHHLCVRNGN